MESTSGQPFKVIVIGSGLAGSLLANGLMNNDVEVAVYERLERNAKREGYQIRLGNSALVGMRACLTPDSIKHITSLFGRAGGLRSGAPVIYDKNFKSLLDLSVFPVYQKSAPISRGILRDTLSDPVFAGGNLQYKKQFLRFEILHPDSANERVRAWFEDGSHDDGDLLIGADGSNSKVNEQLRLNNISQIKTHISFIAKNELPTAEFMKMDPKVRGKPVMTFADKKVMFFCAYLPDKLNQATGEGIKEVDETRSSSMFGCQIPVEDCPPGLLDLDQDAKWNFVSSQFRTWAPEYQEIINLVKGTELYVYRGRASSRPSLEWRQKVRIDGMPEAGHPRVWLLGDAMHAMLPLRGMGGNQSLRDTATVLPLIKEMDKMSKAGNVVTTEKILESLKRYEEEMIPRAFEWVEKSGGQTIMRVDTSTFRGHVHFRLAGYVMSLAYLWFRFKSLFTKETYIDDSPELRD